MTQFSKQSAIINKIKSLVKSTYSWGKKKDDSQISESIARKIQKTSYELSHAKVKDTYTPPYKEIIEQLQVPDMQIFRGAVFNLTQVALNNEKYAKEIISALEKSLDKREEHPEEVTYVTEKINDIKNFLKKKQQKSR